MKKWRVKCIRGWLECSIDAEKSSKEKRNGAISVSSTKGCVEAGRRKIKRVWTEVQRSKSLNFKAQDNKHSI